MFQSTPAHGGRPLITPRAGGANWFQSTPAHGGRHCTIDRVESRTEFQSTPAHGGRHGVIGGTYEYGIVSIHARAWRATTYCSKHLTPEMFQSTPAHGGRPASHQVEHPRKMFQSTPAHGGRRVPASAHALVDGFNPRPRMAGDRNVVNIVEEAKVSIHAREWRATGSSRNQQRATSVSIHARAWRATRRPGWK